MYKTGMFLQIFFAVGFSFRKDHNLSFSFISCLDQGNIKKAKGCNGDIPTLQFRYFFVLLFFVVSPSLTKDVDFMYGIEKAIIIYLIT